MTDWRSRAAHLVDELTEAGKLCAPQWQDAFRTVPRHVFVPEFYQQDQTGAWVKVSTDSGEGLEAVYSNRALFTDVDERGVGVSSSSMPGLMARMLELLDIRRGHRVLEIGTGTGYNAAILCSVLGDRNVFSIDIDYVAEARRRLLSLAFDPTLATRDGLLGLGTFAPYDRIESTVAVSRVPYAWVQQVRDGGLLLTDLKVNTAAGNLVLLRRNGDIAEGRFDSGYAAFMQMRRPGQAEEARPRPSGSGRWPTSTRKTDVPARAWEESVPWFLASLELPRGTVYGYQLEDRSIVASTFTSPDGSRATVSLVDDNGEREVTQSGPRHLWDYVENAYEFWKGLGRPPWERFGLTVTAEDQVVWLDEPGASMRWRLPE